MNGRGRRPRLRLGLCPNCGMDSGERMVREEIPERYIVVCRQCGCHTKSYSDMSAATGAWQRGQVFIHGRRVGKREEAGK